MRRTIMLWITLVILAIAPSTLAAPEEAESWYAGFLGDAKIGWQHDHKSASEEDGQTRWASTSESEITLNRGGISLTIQQSATVVENEEGKVIRFESVQKQGPAEMRTTGRLLEDGQLLIVQNGVEKTVPYPEGALGPVALERTVREAGLEPGLELSLPTFTTDAPDRKVTTTITVGEKEKKDVLGRVKMLYRVTVVTDLLPVPTTAWADDDYRVWAISMAFPGLGEFRFLRTEEKIAKAETEPAEVFFSTMVEPDRPIRTPRELEKAVYRLSRKGEDLSKIYEGEGQEILGREEGALVVSVDRPKLPAEVYELPVSDPALAPYLDPTAFVESEDELVVELSRQALGEITNAVEAARRIEDFVRRKIEKKNLGVGFASAAEVARTLEGDCTEHAVLCAALARAAGLPARVVTGIVYLPPEGGLEKRWKNGVFGYHMWTEILVGKDHWMPIDAAIGTWDATHLALGKSPLDSTNPTLDMVLSMLEVLGTLQIEVVEPE